MSEVKRIAWAYIITILVIVSLVGLLALCGFCREYFLAFSLSTLIFSLEIFLLMFISSSILQSKMKPRVKMVLFLLSTLRWVALALVLYILLKFGYLNALGMAGGALAVSFGVIGAGIAHLLANMGKAEVSNG
jgi:hypothetical protein